MSTDFIPDDQFKPDQVPDRTPSGASSDFIPDNQFQPDEEKYGTLGQQALTAAEGASKGFAGPIATGAEALLSKAGVPGLSPEEQAGREAANPWTHGLFETAGFAGPALATAGISGLARAGFEIPEAASVATKALDAYSQAGALSKVGHAATSALGLGGKGASAASKIGSAAVSGAIENSLFSAGDIGSKIINGQNPSEAIDTAAPYLGLSAIIGGVAGAGLGAVPELWKAAHGSDTAGVLRAVTNKLGGKEGDVVSDPVRRALEAVGVQPAPEVVAAMASDPSIQMMAKALEQSDATSSGQAYQAALKQFHEQAQNAVAAAVGKTPEEIAAIPQISKYEAGQSLGAKLADEYQAKLDPVIKEFEELKGKYKDAPFAPDVEIDPSVTPTQTVSPDYSGVPESVLKAKKPIPSRISQMARASEDAQVKNIEAANRSGFNPYQDIEKVKVPGTASQISDKLGELSLKEGWAGGDPTIEREFNRVMTQLPKQKTLGELTNLITQVGNNTKSTLPFGMQTPLSRAGSLIKSVLRESEEDLAAQHLGAEAPELVSRYRAAQQAYKAQAVLKDALNDRLKVGGSVSGFTKGLREMARTDGEGLLRKLSGAKDADLLGFLNQNFPETAQALKEYHLGNALESAANKAKPGQQISISALQKSIDGMSPELREFAIPKDLTNKLEGMSVLQDQLARVPHNFSNTARAHGVLNKYGIGTAMGMASMLTGHGVAASLLAGEVAHTLSKTAPDATRLALLKFLGSGEAIHAGAFKGMADFIQSAMRGESLLTRATKSIFEAGSKVLPDTLIPDMASRDRLQKSLEYASNPDNAQNIGGSLGHYLPGHATAAAATAATATNYLKSLKPVQIQASPLDKPAPVDRFKKDKYERALDIAQQPLLALKYAKEGTLQAQDVQTLKTIYPALHQKISTQTFEQMAKAMSQGQTIPYSQRVSLSMLMGQPLDSSMTPAMMQTIMSANAPKSGPQNQSQHGVQRSPSKATSSSMERVNKMYSTPQQAREASKLKG